VNGRLILKWIKEMGWERMDWIHMAQDRDKWQTVVNILIYLQAT